jgi:hypothetical protein
MTFGSAGYDYAYGLAKHSAGVYAVGYTDGNLHGAPLGSGDAFVRKYDTSGAVLWGRQFGTPQYDYAEGAASDSGNNVYVAGLTYGSLAGSRGNSDLFLRKYNASGGLLWTRQFGSLDYDSIGDVAVYGSNIYVTGAVGNVSTHDYSVILTKFNSAGTQLWTKLFGTTEYETGVDVAVDGGGNPYVVGYTYGSLGGPNGGEADMFIRKYNAAGAAQWTKQLHYSLGDYARGIAISGSNIYMVGQFYFDAANSQDADVRLIRFSTAGVKTLDVGYGPSGEDYVFDVSADSSGVVFGGYTYTSFGGPNQGNGDGFIFKRRNNGTFWSKQIGTTEFDATYAVLVRSSSEVYATGQTYGVLGGGNSGNSDAYLRRFNAVNGATVWTDQ